MIATAQYGEALPISCPPDQAIETALQPVFRLVAHHQPTPTCFASHLALGKPVPAGVSECEWASCSLNTSVSELIKIKRLRKRLPFVAELSVPAGAGRHLSAKYHIHYWRYNVTNLASFVTNVVKI